MNTHAVGKRVGYSTWAIDGPHGRVLIRRLANQQYLVGRPEWMMTPKFFTSQFRIKAEAVALAQKMAGIAP